MNKLREFILQSSLGLPDDWSPPHRGTYAVVQIDAGLGVSIDDTGLDDVGGDEIVVPSGVDVAADLDSAQVISEGDGKVDVIFLIGLDPRPRFSSSHHGLRRMCVTPDRRQDGLKVSTFFFFYVARLWEE